MTQRDGDQAEMIRQAARAHEPDRYLAALLSPRAVRDDLIVLAAVVGEINRIPHLVADPNLAVIRLTWWRETLLRRDGARSGHPIADAFSATMARHALPVGEIEQWLNAFGEALVAEAWPDGPVRAGRLRAVEGLPFRFSTRILMHSDGEDVASMDAGLCYGLSRLGLDMPHVLRNVASQIQTGEAPSLAARPIDAIAALDSLKSASKAALSSVRARFPGLSPAQRCALLPVALVEPYLHALEKPGHDLRRDIAEVPPIVRAWRILWAHMTNRI